MLVNRGQVAGVGGPEKLGAGGLGHFLQSLFIDPGVERKTFKARNKTIRRPKGHGVDTHPFGSRPLGHLDRIGPGGAATIGQQDHRPRRVRPHRHGLGRLCSPCGRTLVQRSPRLSAPLRGQAARLELGTVQHRLQVNGRFGQQGVQRHQQATAGGRAALQLKAVDGRQQFVFLVRHALHQLGVARKRHHGHAHMVRQFLNKGFGRLLGRNHAAGRHVFGQHAARDVHGQHQGQVVGRQRDPGTGPRGTQQHQRQSAQQQSGRDVPADPVPRTQSGPNQVQTGITHHRGAFAAQRPDVPHHQQGDQQQ